MTGIMMVIHALVCVFLGTIILMQSGRGGGLTESFSSAESVFGAKTSSFLIRVTTVLSVVFFISCLGLAIISTKTGKSIMPNQVAPQAPSGNPLDDLLELEPIDLTIKKKADSEGSAASAITEVQKISDKVSNKVSEMATDVKKTGEKIPGAIADVKDAAGKMSAGVVSDVKGAVEKVPGAVSDVKESAEKMSNNVVSDVKNTVEKISDDAATEVENAVDKLPTIK